jgi:putative membrane protein
MTQSVRTFLKGFLMGVCDTIPGISGGTIAFITGICERLILALKGISPELFVSLILFIVGKENKKVLGENLRKADLGFLFVLLFGIITALLIFSRIMSFLLDNYFSFTMVFFIGLILASAKTIFDHIEKHHSVNSILLIIGLCLGIGLAFVVPTSVNPSMLYVLLGGFVGISAMVLPGISGAFILLIMGLYRFMLGVIESPIGQFEYLVAFIIGALIGLFTISRIVAFLFRKDKSKTLYFLLGLVIGGLSVPIKGIDWGSIVGSSIIIHVLLFILGIIGATAIKRISGKN